MWAARERLCDDERAKLHALYQAAAAREGDRRAPPAELQLGVNEQASTDRVALGRALVEAGILEVRWRSISPPI